MDKKVAIQPGSPLKQAASYLGEELPPLVLWDGKETTDDISLQTSCDPSRPRSRRDRSLGRVTICLRNIPSKHSVESGIHGWQAGSCRRPACTATGARYSMRSAQIVDHVHSHVLLRPVEQHASAHTQPEESPEHAQQSLLTLPQWLRLVRRESSCKAPLPRQWQSLPMASLAELAIERGLQVALVPGARGLSAVLFKKHVFCGEQHQARTLLIQRAVHAGNERRVYVQDTGHQVSPPMGAVMTAVVSCPRLLASPHASRARIHLSRLDLRAARGSHVVAIRESDERLMLAPADPRSSEAFFPVSSVSR